MELSQMLFTFSLFHLLKALAIFFTLSPFHPFAFKSEADIMKINHSKTPMRVSLFDFDGTLTTLDTLPAFIAHAVGRWRMLVGFGLYLPLIVLMKLRLYPNGQTKERLFTHFFKGMTLETFDAHCQSFAKNNAHILRPQGMKTVEEACQRGESVLVVSASITNWVLPFFRQLPQVQVIGTQIAVENGTLTGRFASPNCHGAEKVRRVENLFTPREQYYITAYGDSQGDKEMLDYADEPHYKPFRTK